MISLNETQLVDFLSPLLWPFLRILAVFTAAPIFSSKAFPVRAKIALSFFIAYGSQASLTAQPMVSFMGPDALGAVVQQIGVGLAIGFTIRLVFSSMELAGEIVGYQMGLNYAVFFDPSLNTQSSAVARFYGHMASFLFLVMNGHLMVMMAVIKSFDAFPVGQNFLLAVKTLKIHQLGANLFASALWIALPIVGMLMFVNLVLGIVSRIAPQMNIFSIGFPITLTIGLIGIFVTLPMLDQPLTTLMAGTIDVFLGKN